MNRITNAHIDGALNRLNTVLGMATEPYTKTGDKYLPNAGNYHLDCAYGGYRLCRMADAGTGTHDISPRGTKREVYEYIHAMLRGIEAASRI